jgi:hypothetical protein
MSNSIEPLPEKFIEGGIEYDVVIRNKNWAIFKRQTRNGVRFEVSRILLRDGQERVAHPEYNEIYGYTFPDLDDAVLMFAKVMGTAI